MSTRTAGKNGKNSVFIEKIHQDDGWIIPNLYYYAKKAKFFSIPHAITFIKM